MTLRITHLTCVFPPYKGGIGSVTQKYAQIAINNSYNVSVYTPNYQKTKHIEKKNNNITIYRILPKFKLGNAGYINIKKYILEADILHIHYPFYGSIIPAILRAKKLNIKIILSWHMNPRGKGIKGLIFKSYEKLITPWVFKNVDQILVSTKDYFNDHLLFKKFENKIKELPFSINPEKFKIQEKNLQLVKEYELENKKVLIFVGGLDDAHYFKGVELLIRIMPRLDQKYSLIIVGDGNLKEDYKRLTEELDIAKRVIFTGGINDKDLIEHYSLADVLILPSINQGEAFGIVQIEAMACSKPVIVSDLPGVRTVLSPQTTTKTEQAGSRSAGKNNQTGFTFEIGNSKDLIHKINELFISEERYQKFSENARQRVLENFSDNIISKKLIDIYKSLHCHSGLDPESRDPESLPAGRQEAQDDIFRMTLFRIILS